MTAVTIDLQAVAIQDVTVSEDTLSVDLVDGRTISVPLGWYPRLWHATDAERSNWRLIGNGVGVHWPDLDEDISAEGLILGKSSRESQRSLNQWLESRSADVS
ncbi:MAG: DUF2442 domain-containing protein [Anaerolineae bacterium]|nr:DUF2442 domain-containing protein [Anaerolineae bacterium]MCO5186827.1 DUF2442 domain-containing protein [Anaerolineae bacterium]MCO5194048.1 DUF2442 domain-containing protein [Anaerolineae bacterium]MCO5196579.1 DUF2442 domain-containing protein [Anaerolineae bacterium]